MAIFDLVPLSIFCRSSLQWNAARNSRNEYRLAFIEQSRIVILRFLRMESGVTTFPCTISLRTP